MNNTIYLYRGEVFYFKYSPLESKDCYCYFPDGLLVVSEGKIVETGAYEDIKDRYPGASLTDYSGKLLMPGLIRNRR